MTSARPRSAQLAPPAGRSSTGYVTFVVLLAFLAWALVSMDNVMLGVAVPALAPALHLSLSTMEYLVGVFSFVTFAAPVLAGRLIDRIGRRANFQLSLVGTGIFGGLTALVANAWQFIVVRLLVSTSYGLTEPVINTLVAEEAPRHRRGVLMGFVQAGYPLGAGIAGTIAAVLLPTHGWRPLFYLAFAPLLLVLAAGWFLRDSARFKQVKAASEQRAIEHRPGWRKLFTPEQRRQTIVTSVFGFCINGGIGLIIGVVTTYLVHVDHLSLGAAAFLFGLSNWVALGSQILVGWLADYLPSKWLMTGYSVLAAAALALLAIPGLSFTTATVSLVAFGFFGNGTFGCYTRYTTESYPTELRGTGTSFSLGCSFLTLSFMPIIGGALIDSAMPTAIPLISAALVLIGAGVMACGKSFAPRRDLDELSPSKLLSD
ncbi:MFS transporter [Amycolatopsis carbonis]|uniref:MFS transporter n=1 Tax=Amycolatopsis carbonis TaxID=715471 RepID=A0A9Y2MU20_9PSEU|nr:MFS transporter [Amycolatopsis sp. 2-15]WIX75474.1 MFS transporter [Amycolatopsis sp. 2-15]